MPETRSDSPAVPLSPASTLLRLGVIAVVVAVAAGAFAYVRGVFDPGRLTPDALVDQLQTDNGVFPGYRRNHAKGVCVVGYFESAAPIRQYSSAKVFQDARTPVVGRFALPTGSPYSPDTAAPIRSFALRFSQSDGEQWRTGMNAMPSFPVGTPQAFLEMLKASAPDPATGKPNPAHMGQFFAAHPEAAPFLAWVKTAKPSASYATETYNSINAFYLVDGTGQRRAVRWSVVPHPGNGVSEPGLQSGDFLDKDLQQHLAAGPLHWDLKMTMAEAGDPVDDATKAWPAERAQVIAGSLTIEKAEAQNDGECRDINYDPLILPNGIQASGDPLLPARSAAYATSYLRRTSEVDQLKNAHADQEPRS
ncbi:catalase family peroxidase [Pseudomonas sp. dw_358]|uniref:catalase family peroxidase n=1 Tax=Pseudomonas sp. dw_358 TaxID=2720083 RepID=UPI001BD4C5C0|nr:catalase family peroxidase [Pseudomonas sp. dw_358]